MPAGLIANAGQMRTVTGIMLFIGIVIVTLATMALRAPPSTNALPTMAAVIKSAHPRALEQDPAPVMLAIIPILMATPAFPSTTVLPTTAAALSSARTSVPEQVHAAATRDTHRPTTARLALRSTSAVQITAAASRPAHTLGQEPDRALAIQATL